MQFINYNSGLVFEFFCVKLLRQFLLWRYKEGDKIMDVHYKMVNEGGGGEGLVWSFIKWTFNLWSNLIKNNWRTLHISEFITNNNLRILDISLTFDHS